MVYFFGFLGGLALFLYGMQLMGDGLQRAAVQQQPDRSHSSEPRHPAN